MYNQGPEFGHQHQEQEQPRKPLRRIQFHFADPQLAQTADGRLLSEYFGVFNNLSEYVALRPESHFETISDVQNATPELNTLLSFQRQMRAVSQQHSGHSDMREEELFQSPPVQHPTLSAERVEINNETDLAIQTQRLYDVRHAIGGQFHLIQEVVHLVSEQPDFSFLSKIPGLLDRNLEELKEVLGWSIEAMKNIFTTEDIPVDEISRLLNAKIEAAHNDILLNIDIVQSSKTVQSSASWIHVLLADLVQNVTRKRADIQIAGPTFMTISGKELKDGYELAINDDGGGFPKEILKSGFKVGVGNNQGGEHRAMARHQEIAEQLGGSLKAVNRVSRGKTLAEVRLFIPNDPPNQT